MIIINKKILIVRYLRPNFATDSSVLYSFRDERWYLKGKGVHLEEWRESLLELDQKESESISDCISKLRDNDKIFESSQKKMEGRCANVHGQLKLYSNDDHYK